MHAWQFESRRRRMLLLATACCALGFGSGPRVAVGAEVDEADPVEFYLLDQLSHDDNLFRVSAALASGDPAAVGVSSFDDTINRASGGMHARWDSGRQVLGLHLRLDDVRYNRNDNLDHTGGSGMFNWDWQAASRLSGRFNAQYDRSIASFSNYQFFLRDLVEVVTYGAEVRYRIGSRWVLLGAGSDARTEHSAEPRQLEDYHNQSGRAGLEYHTLSENILALEYRYSSADFPNAEALSGDFARRYREGVPTLRAVYAFSDQTRFEGRVGYLDRDYRNPMVEDYAGGVWNATLGWKYSDKTSFEAKAWHELRSYEDAQSDYFVAAGGSLGVNWSPRTTLKLALLWSHENQDYVTAGSLLPVLSTPREDQVSSYLVSVDYAPRRKLSFRLSYRWAEYDSNQDLRDYRDRLVSGQVRFSF